jgi:V/A-type H+-transporting ATPase subunit E
MDIQLQELIDKIKKDGIESASQEAASLKAQAEKEAAAIVEAARKEAEAIVAAGKASAARDEKSGIAAVEQASRNLVLAFKDEIQGLLDRLVASKLAEAYNADTLKKALPDILKGWAKGADKLEVILPESEAKALEGFFKGELVSALKQGVQLRSSRSLGGGFRIAEKGGGAYYDFSAESVAELLSAYLNPRLAAVLSGAAKGI